MADEMPEQMIVVVFDVSARTREEAARAVSLALGQPYLDELRHNSGHRIESWWFPEPDLKHVDGNDNAPMALVPADALVLRPPTVLPSTPVRAPMTEDEEIELSKRVAAADVARLTMAEMPEARRTVREMLKVPKGGLGDFTTPMARAYWREKGRLLGLEMED